MTVTDDAAIRHTILAIGQEVFAAISQKDVATLGRFFADEFIHGICLRSRTAGFVGQKTFRHFFSPVLVQTTKTHALYKMPNHP